MTSVSKAHKEIILEHVARNLYSTGIRPNTSTILQYLSRYFGQNPPSAPLKSDAGTNGLNLKSDPEAVNGMMANAILNLTMLYRANFLQGEELMHLNTTLRTYLDKLMVKRTKLMNQLDDYLLSLYNTDGYFFSISDGFSDVDKVSLDLSSAFVDVAAGKVTLPITSALSVNTIYRSAMSYSIEAFIANPEGDEEDELSEVSFVTVGNLSNAFDGLSNTVWAIEIEREQKEEIVVNMGVSFSYNGTDSKISRIEFDPFGVQPVQMHVETIQNLESTNFGQRVVTSDRRTAFIDEARFCSGVKFSLRKTEPDYTRTSGGKTYYKYIFGAKDISITKSIYDNEAVLVSQPLSIWDLSDAIIDAVSITTEDDTPPGTSIQYYVAKDSPGITAESQLDWKEINPVGSVSDENTVVNFNSTTITTNMMRLNPTGSELQLAVPTLNEALLPVGSAYELSSVDFNDVIPETLSLDEGFNTARIYYKTGRENTYVSLDNWKTEVLDTSYGKIAYGRIDSGRGFFNGTIVGEANTSFYIETFLDSPMDTQTIVRELVKQTPSAAVWDVKVFLNGEEIANLPSGTVSVPVSWKFRRGLNHISLLVDIPRSNSTVRNPEWGSLDLMFDDVLFNYGVVRLNKWEYVDEHSLNVDDESQNDASVSPQFSLINNRLVSRKKPTDNFRIRYAKPNNRDPDAIRLKAVLTRNTEDVNVTPSIDIYRLRFQYGEG